MQCSHEHSELALTLCSSTCPCCIYTFLKVFSWSVFPCSPQPHTSLFVSPSLGLAASFLSGVSHSFVCHFYSRSVSLWMIACCSTSRNAADVTWRLHLACQWRVTPSWFMSAAFNQWNVRWILRVMVFWKIAIDVNDSLFKGNWNDFM